MILGLIIVILLIVGICAISYRGALHEFQILQKDYNPENKWPDFLSEQLPLVIRNLPPNWLGNWSRSKTEQKNWPVQVKNTKNTKKTKKPIQTTFQKWLEYSETPIENGKELGEKSKLDVTIRNWFSRWFWIPTSIPHPYVLSDAPSNSCIPLRKATADATAIVSTDGSPVEVWLSHEAGIPDAIVDSLRGLNPWIQSTNEIPGVEKVKFIEVRLRPGNAIVVPTHWWYSVRSVESDSWFWIHEFQSPISWLATRLQSKN
jgi:hypothetical protein